MHVHLREAEVGDVRGLEGAQHLVLVHFAGAKLLEQPGCFSGCHKLTMPENHHAVTRENKFAPLLDYGN